MGKIVDLTHAITHRMAVFPGDPVVDFSRHHDYQNGYFISHLSLGTHTGTHVDAPIHNIKGAEAVDEIPVSRFIGRAYVMDVSQIAHPDEISKAVLAPFADKVRDVSAILFKSGWSARFGECDFFTAFAGLDESAVDWLVENGISLVGMETPSVNAQRHLEIHEMLLSRGIVIVESLANVDALRSEYVTFHAVPLKLKGLDGSPVRAYAIEE